MFFFLFHGRFVGRFVTREVQKHNQKPLFLFFTHKSPSGLITTKQFPPGFCFFSLGWFALFFCFIAVLSASQQLEIKNAIETGHRPWKGPRSRQKRDLLTCVAFFLPTPPPWPWARALQATWPRRGSNWIASGPRPMAYVRSRSSAKERLQAHRSCLLVGHSAPLLRKTARARNFTPHYVRFV
jgi:hypothetical protein